MDDRAREPSPRFPHAYHLQPFSLLTRDPAGIQYA